MANRDALRLSGKSVISDTGKTDQFLFIFSLLPLPPALGAGMLFAIVADNPALALTEIARWRKVVLDLFRLRRLTPAKIIRDHHGEVRHVGRPKNDFLRICYRLHLAVHQYRMTKTGIEFVEFFVETEYEIAE